MQPTDQLWGKQRGLDEPYSLIGHLLDTAAVTHWLTVNWLSPGQRRHLADALGVDGDELAGVLALWAGLHDLGKATPCFQHQHRGMPHARATQSAIVLEALLPDSSPRVTRRIGQLLSGHHGRYQVPRPDTGEWDAHHGGADWVAARSELTGTLLDILDPVPAPATLPAASAHLVCGLVILADWLVSQTSFVRHQQAAAHHDARSHFDAARAAAEGLAARAGLRAPKQPAAEFGAQFTGWEPRGIQAAVTGISGPRLAQGGIVTLMAPTGEGKTEAALWAATQIGSVDTPGVFVALPTQATATEMQRRVQRWAVANDADTHVPLLHGMAALEDIDADAVTSDDAETVAAANAWLRGPKRGLLAGCAVGTIDQVLVTVLRSKHNSLRMLGLTNKVLVVDEAHAYDPYMQALLRRALRWLGHFGVPVVLCSATMPRHVAQSLHEAYLGRALDPLPVTYPGWVHTTPAGTTTGAASHSPDERMVTIRRRRHEVTPEALTAAATSEALDAAAAGACVAVICNTVRVAQRTFTALRDAGADDVLLLHSRLPVGERRRRTRQLVERYGKGGSRPTGSIVVATQVIEQSLDVDFDVLITELAPVAQLIQRIGRVHRHDGPDRPAAFSAPGAVVLCATGTDPVVRPTTFVYDRSLLGRTHDLLPEHLAVPGGVQELVDSVYAAPEWSAADPDGKAIHDYLERLAKTAADTQIGTITAIPEPTGGLDLYELTSSDLTDNATRLGADSVRLLPVWEDADGNLHLTRTCDAPLPSEPGPAALREVLDASIVAPQRRWHAQRLSDGPGTWADRPWLADLQLLVFTSESMSSPDADVVRVDPELGLVET